jgi:hypothetical protein
VILLVFVAQILPNAPMLYIHWNGGILEYWKIGFEILQNWVNANIHYNLKLKMDNILYQTIIP